MRGWKGIAALLCVSRWTAARWHERHGLPVSRDVCGRVTARVEDVVSWARRHGVWLPGL